MRELRVLVVRLDSEHASWGDARIRGAIGELGHQMGGGQPSLGSLKSEGFKPAPEHPSSWSAFIKATWGESAAPDFFTTEVCTSGWLTTALVDGKRGDSF